MTHRDDRNGFEFETQADSASGGFQEILELLAEHGFEGMAHAMQVLLNEAMKLERSHVLVHSPTSARSSAVAMPTATNPRRSRPASAVWNWRCRRPVASRFIRRLWSAARAVNER